MAVLFNFLDYLSKPQAFLRKGIVLFRELEHHLLFNEQPFKKGALGALAFSNIPLYDEEDFREQGSLLDLKYPPQALMKQVVSPFIFSPSNNIYPLHCTSTAVNSLWYSTYNTTRIYSYKSGRCVVPSTVGVGFGHKASLKLVEIDEPDSQVYKPLRLLYKTDDKAFVFISGIFLDKDSTNAYLLYSYSPSANNDRSLVVLKIDESFNVEEILKVDSYSSENYTVPPYVLDWNPESKKMIVTADTGDDDTSLSLLELDLASKTSTNFTLPVREIDGWSSHWALLEDSELSRVFVGAYADTSLEQITFKLIIKDKTTNSYSVVDSGIPVFAVGGNSSNLYNGGNRNSCFRFYPVNVDGQTYVLAWLENKITPNGVPTFKQTDPNGKKLARIWLLKYNSSLKTLELLDEKELPLPYLSGFVVDWKGKYGKAFMLDKSLDVVVDYANGSIAVGTAASYGYYLLGVDEFNRFWGLRSTGEVELFGKKLPYRVKYSLEVSDSTPESYPVDATFKIDVFDYTGKRIAADVQLVVLTPDVAEFDDGSVRKVITTSTDSTTEVPIKIKTDGVVVIDETIIRIPV